MRFDPHAPPPGEAVLRPSVNSILIASVITLAKSFDEPQREHVSTHLFLKRLLQTMLNMAQEHPNFQEEDWLELRHIQRSMILAVDLVDWDPLFPPDRQIQ